MQAEYWALAIVGIPIGILLFFYVFAKAVKTGKSAKKPGMAPTNKENLFVGIYARIKGKLGGKIKLPKLSLVHWIIIAALVVIGVNFVWVSTHTTTYTFTSTNNLSSNWQINSGSNNLKVENGCLIISGPVSMTIKSSENVDWTDIKITPCGQELNDITVGAGNLAFRYYFGQPPDTNYAWDKGSIYHIGSISTSAGTKVSVFFPSTGNLKRNNKPRTLLIERGAVILPNYKMSARGSGTFDSITLADSYYSEAAGKGKIGIKTAGGSQGGSQKIKNIEVREGLLPRI